MSTFDWIILTPSEAVSAAALDGDGVILGARLVDGPAAGTLMGQFVVPARVLTDPDYARWVPNLAGLPTASLRSEDLFLDNGE